MTSRLHSIRIARALLVVAALLMSTAWDARAGGCKPNGQQCQTSVELL